MCAITCAASATTSSYNHPYKGVELVRRYGDPAQHRHSIQVEINRKLYMDEDTLELNGDSSRSRGTCARWWSCCWPPTRGPS